MSDTGHEPNLQDVFFELVSSVERPDAETLEDFVGRYPQFAAELTDFAVEWALQDLLPAEESSDEAGGAGDEPGTSAVPTSAVTTAMRRFRERLAELDQAAGAADGATVPGAGTDPFAGRGPAELARIASDLGLDKTIMAKLRDRKIVADTVPRALRQGLAEHLEVPLPAIAVHLSGPAVVQAGVSFKAPEAPRTGPKEPFAEAVRRSFLPEEEKARWLAGQATSGGD